MGNNRGLSGQIGSANLEQLVGFHRIGDPGRTVKQGYSFPIMSGLDQSYRISLFDPSDGSTDNLPLGLVQRNILILPFDPSGGVPKSALFNN